MKGDKHDVIVVGGGLCGLRAAEILRSQGANVLLLEASDKLGGSAGCQKTVSSDSAGLLQLAASLNVPTIRISHEKLLKTLELSNSTLRFTGGVATALPWLAHLDLNHLFRRTDLLSTKVPPDAPWRAAESGSWDTESVLGWLQREGWNAEARRVYATLVRVALADDPANVSLLYWLWICRMAGGFRRLFAEYDLEKIHPEGGVAGIIDALTNTIGKDRIRLGCQVTEVDWSHPRHVTLVCNQREDDQLKDVLGPVERFCARYVIFALPPSQLCCGLEFRPPLPEFRRKTCACIRASRVLRLELTYAESFWLARGLGGFFASEPGPVSHGLPSALAPDKLICYVVGAEAERLAALAPAQRQQAVCAHLARIFDCADALRPVSVTEADSASTQLTRRDHPYVLAPGALTGGSVASFWEPLGGRVFFANTLMAAVWPQHLEGALQVAERVANDVFLRFSQTDGRGKVFLRRQASYPAAGIDPTSPRTAAIDLDQQPPPMLLPPPAAESVSAEKPPAPDEQSACLQEWQASPGLPSLNDLVRYSAAAAALVASGLILWRRAHV